MSDVSSNVANPIPYNVTVGYDEVRQKDKKKPTQWTKKEFAYFGKGGKRKKI